MSSGLCDDVSSETGEWMLFVMGRLNRSFGAARLVCSERDWKRNSLGASACPATPDAGDDGGMPRTLGSEGGGTFAAAWRGDTDTDRFGALVLRAGLSWREVAVLRAYARYARQLGNPYGVNYMADTLLAHPAVARALLQSAGHQVQCVADGALAVRAVR